MTDGQHPAQPPTLEELLKREDRAIHETLRQLDAVQGRLGQWLRPATATRRRERDALQAKLDAHDADERQSAEAAAAARRLTEELAAARLEIDALRQSRSWRLMRPLRMLHRWLYRLPGRD